MSAREFSFSNLDEEIETKMEMMEYLKIPQMIEEDFEEVMDFIISSKFFKVREGMISFLKLLSVVLRERALELELYSKLIVALCERVSLFKDAVSEWCKSLFSAYGYFEFQPETLFIINYLREKGVIDEATLIDWLSGLGVRYANTNLTAEMIICYFAPELSTREDLYNAFIKPRLEFPILARVRVQIPETWLQHPEYRENDWELWKAARLRLWMFNPILEIMLKDDERALIELSSDPSFDKNGVVTGLVMNPLDYIRNGPTYIGLAAWCRATKCFTFLKNIGASLSRADSLGHTPAQFAAASGCIEILRMLEQEKVDFTGALQVAAGFSRYDILEWISTKVAMDDHTAMRGTVMTQAAVENNMQLMRMCMDEGMDVNAVLNGRNLIYRCALYDSYEVLKMLLAREDINPVLVGQTKRESAPPLSICGNVGSFRCFTELIRRMRVTDEELFETLDEAACGSCVSLLKEAEKEVPDKIVPWLRRHVTVKWKLEVLEFIWKYLTDEQKVELRRGYEHEHPDRLRVSVLEWIDAHMPGKSLKA